MTTRVLSIVFSIIFVQVKLVEARPPEEYVNILGGTESSFDLSHGGVLPLLGRPWGFNYWAPQTNVKVDDRWWFHPDDRRFYGIRCTHQPSPWLGDYGSFLIKSGFKQTAHLHDHADASGYSPKEASFSPYFLKAEMFAYRTENGPTEVEFTATSHGGVLKSSFPRFNRTISRGLDQTRRIGIVVKKGSVDVQVNGDGAVWIVGKSTQAAGDVPANFAHYFVARLLLGENGNLNPAKGFGFGVDSDWAFIDLDEEDPNHQKVFVRVATSFISIEQAMQNYISEVDESKSFESLVNEAKTEWNLQLSKISLQDVGASYSQQQQDDMKTVFYSCMYRASLYPRQLSETDSEGNIIHWSPFDLNGNIYSGPISVDSGFWDAYIAVYPLHSLINTDVLGPKMITGWLNAYKEGGWVPKWASPGYRLSMIATMSDVSLADAIVKGIPGFDLNLAYEAIRKNAFVRPTDGIDGRGRVCFDAYAELGYIPRGENSTAGGLCSSVVSRTLNYLQSDWAISQAARVLNHSSDAVLLEAKSKEYKALFDPTTGFFRAKNLDGKFAEPFDEFLWNSDFIEGSAWQYRFYVPHDPEGLSTLYSASGFSLCDELLRAQTIPSIYHLDIGYEIPEQTELRENVWGQYGHNDQPSHHILYMFQASDPDGYRGKCAAKGMPWLRKAMTSLYKPGYDMFSGDEDNGEMSSWFILSSLGLYSLSPGSLDYNIGVPLYSKVQVNLGEGKYLNIIAENNGPDNYYVQSVSWNGKPLDTSAKSISYKDLMEGGDLVFQMGSKPFSQDTI